MLFGATLALSTASFAQTQTEAGNIIIDPYIGVPNWANSLFYNNYDTDQTEGEQSNVSNYRVNGGQLSYGGRLEYMISDNFGIGADVNYEVSGFNFDYDDIDTATNQMTQFNYDYTAKKLRAMFRLNYHFVQTDRMDAYAGFAGGYKYVSRMAYEENISTGQRTELDGPGALIPVAIRLSVGTRFYFTDNIGAHVELGAFGGGLLQFGISAKF